MEQEEWVSEELHPRHDECQYRGKNVS